MRAKTGGRWVRKKQEEANSPAMRGQKVTRSNKKGKTGPGGRAGRGPSGCFQGGCGRKSRKKMSKQMWDRIARSEKRRCGKGRVKGNFLRKERPSQK